MVTQRTISKTLVLLSGVALLAGCGPPPKKAVRERVEMWATGAQASSVGDPNSTDYSEIQALGSPDVSVCADDPNAWSPFQANADPASVGGDPIDDWLVVTFPEYAFVHQVKIYESFNVGAIVAVDLETSDGSLDPLPIFENFSGSGPGGCPSAFVIEIDQGTTYDQYNRVAIYLDTNLVDGFNEIDAVQMVGDILVPAGS